MGTDPGIHKPGGEGQNICNIPWPTSGQALVKADPGIWIGGRVGRLLLSTEVIYKHRTTFVPFFMKFPTPNFPLIKKQQ